MAEIASEAALRALYGPVGPRAARKVIHELDDHCRNWLAHCPFVLLATGVGSELDVSPKGDAPGFVQVEDEKHILLPDWPGNNRLDGMSNILRNPGVALIAVIPNVKDTLRINGRATIHDDEALRARFEMRGKRPVTVTRIAVEEAFMHCPKAFMRAGLWEPDTWPAKGTLPTLGEILKDHCEMEGPVQSAEEQEAEARTKLY